MRSAFALGLACFWVQGKLLELKRELSYSREKQTQLMAKCTRLEAAHAEAVNGRR